MRRKKLLSAILSLTLVANMYSICAYAAPEDSAESVVSSDSSTVMSDSPEEENDGDNVASTEGDVSKEDVTTTTADESSIPPEVNDSTSTSDDSKNDEEEVKSVKGGEVCINLGGGLDINMLKGISFSIINVTDDTMIREFMFSDSSQCLVEEDYICIDLEDCQFSTDKEYKIVWGSMPVYDMYMGYTLVCGERVEGNEASFTVKEVPFYNEDGEEVMKLFPPVIEAGVCYAEGRYIEVENMTRGEEAIRNAEVVVRYRGNDSTYTTDEKGMFMIPIYDNDWNVIFVSANDGAGHFLENIQLDNYASDAMGVQRYTLYWEDGDTYGNDWGYDSDISCNVNVTVNSNGDASLYTDYKSGVKIGVTPQGAENSIYEFTVDGGGEIELPAFDKGAYNLSVEDANGYDVYLSSTTLNVDGNVQNLNVTLTPKYSLKVVKVVGGNVVPVSFTIDDNSYNSDGEYIFETHPTSTFVVKDNDTGETYDVSIPWEYTEVVLTLGDNPGVAVNGAIGDSAGGSSGKLIGSNENPKTFDGIAGIVGGLIITAGITGVVVYKKKKGIKM